MLSVDTIRNMGVSLSTYMPLNEDQENFVHSDADIKWLFGGNRSGKTYNNIMDLCLLALDAHPFRKVANGIHWACTESWEQARDILWTEYIKKFIPNHYISDIMFGQWRVPKKIYLTTGHVIELKAFNQGRELFQGRAIDSCHCDEQCHHDFQGIFNELQARLTDKQGYLSWSMTPIIPQSMLEDRIKASPKTDAVFYFNLNDNRISEGGYISDERIDALIEDWPEEVQSTRVKGLFASFYGAVYKTFNTQLHVVEPFDIPGSWHVVKGIDFGFNNPFVCLWCAVDNDGCWYVYHEYYQSQTGLEDHALYIKKHNKTKKEERTLAYADHDSQDRYELNKYGIETVNANKAVHAGIEMVQKYLKVKKNNKPRLCIFNTCKNVIREFASYCYPKGTNMKDPQDAPLAKNDHTLDALRYALYSELAPADIVEASILGQLY